MLVRFVVSNFLSFKEETEFNMLPGPFKTHKHHVYELNKVKVLKSAAIYGANGAGKSNFIKAISFLVNLIKDGEIAKSINDKKFKLDTDNFHKPVGFEIELYIEDKVYSYGVTIDDTIIVEEWLYEYGITSEDKLIFKRELTGEKKQSIELAPEFSLRDEDKLLIKLMEEGRVLKENELLFSKAQELKIPNIGLIKKWIENHIVIILPTDKNIRLVLGMNERWLYNANQLLKCFDTGVMELKNERINFDKFFGEDKILQEVYSRLLEKNNTVPYQTESGDVLLEKNGDEIVVNKITTIHKDNMNNEIVFDFNNESDGTLRLIDFLSPFISVINNQGQILLIDEIDQSLHPSLLKELIKGFMDFEHTKGQWIFTTHESNLLDLDIFRQDEIWFTEKKQDGATTLYPMSDFKPRYDLDIRKGYLNGRFGAIPFLGNLKDLDWDKYAKETEQVI